MSEAIPATPAQDTPKAGTAETIYPPATPATPVPAVEPVVEVAKPDEKKVTDTPQKPVVPEKYEFKVPEGSHLDASHLEKIASYAKAQGLSNEQAQVILERENEAVSSYVQNQHETMEKTQGAWMNQIQADPEIGGTGFKQNVEYAKRVVDRFGSDALKQELSKTGLGNHPELVRVFSRIGKIMSNDQLVLPGSQGGHQRNIEDIFYPKT